MGHGYANRRSARWGRCLHHACEFTGAGASRRLCARGHASRGLWSFEEACSAITTKAHRARRRRGLRKRAGRRRGNWGHGRGRSTRCSTKGAREATGIDVARVHTARIKAAGIETARVVARRAERSTTHRRRRHGWRGKRRSRYGRGRDRRGRKGRWCHLRRCHLRHRRCWWCWRHCRASRRGRLQEARKVTRRGCWRRSHRRGRDAL